MNIWLIFTLPYIFIIGILIVILLEILQYGYRKIIYPCLACSLLIIVCLQYREILQNKWKMKNNILKSVEAQPVELVSSFTIKEIAVEWTLKTYGTIHSTVEFEVLNESSGKITNIANNILLNTGEVFLKFDDEYENILLENQKEKEILQQEKINNFQELVKDNLLPEMKLNEAKYELKNIQTEIKKLEHKINMSKLIAPTQGYFVKEDHIDIGAFCTPNRKLGRFFSNDFTVIFYINDDLLKHMNKQKDQVFFTLQEDSGLENIFEGKIQDIYPVVDSEKRTNLYKCVCLLTKKVNSSSLLFGKTGVVKLVLDAQRHILVIPETALINYGPNYYVYVIQNGEAILTEVECIERLGNGGVVIQGIQEGMQIIRDGTSKISNHQKVTIYKNIDNKEKK